MDISYVLGFLAAVTGVLYFWYTQIISRRNKADQALAGVDVQLNMRSDLIPNILTIAKKFMDHEKTLLTNITELRTKINSNYNKKDKTEVASHLAAATELAGMMSQLQIAVENYPTLKSDQTMINAMQTYNEVEAQIAAARRFYNASVMELRNSIQIFPGSMLAKLTDVSDLPLYRADESSTKPIDAKTFLN